MANCPLPLLQPVSLADFKTPGAELGGVNYLRNVQDADALLAAIKQCKEAGGKVRAGQGGVGRCPYRAPAARPAAGAACCFCWCRIACRLAACDKSS
jgi:hypothetical protein